jgi:hypothetical protein
MGGMDLRAGEISILTADVTLAWCPIGLGVSARASGGMANPAATERAARNVVDLDQFMFKHSFETNEKKELPT